jgi:hypothetical protein
MSVALLDTEIERGTPSVREMTRRPIGPLAKAMITVMESEGVKSEVMEAGHAHDAALRPAAVCQQLLQATDASEGRRKRRKRNTTPDRLGMELKRALFEAIVADDPDPDLFEAWLFARVQASGTLAGATRAMALQVSLPAASAPGWPPAHRATTPGRAQTWAWIRGSKGASLRSEGAGSAKGCHFVQGVKEKAGPHVRAPLPPEGAQRPTPLEAAQRLASPERSDTPEANWS